MMVASLWNVRSDLERGYFPWPTAKDGVAHLTQAQLSMLVEGIYWRRPAWAPAPGRMGLGPYFTGNSGKLLAIHAQISYLLWHGNNAAVYAAPCNCPTCGGAFFLKAADKVVQVMEHAEIYDRLGIDTSRSVMADWVGRVSVLLSPLILLIRAHIAAVTDDTPVDVLEGLSGILCGGP